MQMIRPLSEMENRHNINVSTADALQMVPFEVPATSTSDIMARRLKNRERQRRYRARKRHEADLKKACAVNLLSSSHPQVLAEVNGAIAISNDVVTRIHCRRDWKKDARRAHMFKDQVSPIPNFILTTGSQIPPLTFGRDVSSQLPTEFHYPRGSLILEKTETHSSAPSRRNWKAEARNKKE